MGIALRAPVLAVDPGEVHIGLAISDPTGTIARPLEVLRHVSRQADVQAILDRAGAHAAALLLVGLALDSDGAVGPQARRGLRLAEALRAETRLPVDTYDESGSTRAARRPGLNRGRPDRMIDARAAAVFLQEYLDARRTT
jgi:putative Holliday junction resolvase